MSRRLADPARPGLTAPIHSTIESITTTSSVLPDHGPSTRHSAVAHLPPTSIAAPPPPPPPLMTSVVQPSSTGVPTPSSLSSERHARRRGSVSSQSTAVASSSAAAAAAAAPPSRPPHVSRSSQTKRATTTVHASGLAPLPSAFSELHLAPATRTSVVTTTTTTTVHFAPILVPRTQPIRPAQSSFSAADPSRRNSLATTTAPPLTPKSSFAALLESEERRAVTEDPLRLDPKMYPLSQAPFPGGIKRFKMELGALKATFFEGGEAAETDEIGQEGEFDQPEGDDNLGAVRYVAAISPSAEGRRASLPHVAASNGKGKERAGSAGSAQLGGVNPFLSKTERGPLHQRRLSRRSRASAGGDQMQAGEDTIDEDDERVDASLLGDSTTMHVDGDDVGPPRKRPRAASSARQRSPSVESEAGASLVSQANLSSVTGPMGRRDSISGQSHLSGTGLVAGTLPSPNLSPPSPVPTFADEDCKDQDLDERPESPTSAPHDIAEESTLPNQFDLGSGHALSGLLSLPDFVHTFDQLSPALQSYFIFTFLKRSPIPVLQTINNIIVPALRRDFLTDLPPELGVHILGFLDAKALCRASVVCKGWRRLVDGEWRVWKQRLIRDELWVGDGSEEIEAKEIITGSRENLFLKRWRAGVWDDLPGASVADAWAGEDVVMNIEGLRSKNGTAEDYLPASNSSRRPSQPVRLASPLSSREASPYPQGHFVHPFKTLYRRRFVARGNWTYKTPRRVTFACNANNVVTCLQFDKDRIVSASDDHAINVWDTRTGEPRATLEGHEGGVWALQYIGNVLVSGSTDRTVRVWDLDQGRCTHTFAGHTSTVRCLQIIEPQNVNPDPTGMPIWEPPFPLIVTGSRDWSLRVWKLPTPGKDAEFHPVVQELPVGGKMDLSDNPYHLRHLSGHRHAVRALAAHGRIVVSGSYDGHVRVWDVMTGQCLHRLTGHSQKVYSVVYDHRRAQCASGSMDGTVRLWSTISGECLATLDGHSSLVGLLGLSHRNLVSAAADSTLRVWDPATGRCRHVLAAHSGAITCFQHDEYKVISGSDGTLKMWNVRDGSFTRDLLTGVTGVWQVAFDRRFCVAAIQRGGQSEFEVLDFFPEESDDDEDEEGGDDAVRQRKPKRGGGRPIEELIIDSDDDDEEDDDDDDSDDDGSEGMMDDDDDAPNEGTGGFSARRSSRRTSDQDARIRDAPRRRGSRNGTQSRQLSQGALFGVPTVDVNETTVTAQNGWANPVSSSTTSPTSSRRRPPPTMLCAEEFPRRASNGSAASARSQQDAPIASTSGSASAGRQLRRVASANRLSANQTMTTPTNQSSSRRGSSQRDAVAMDVEQNEESEEL